MQTVTQRSPARAVPSEGARLGVHAADSNLMTPERRLAAPPVPWCWAPPGDGSVSRLGFGGHSCTEPPEPLKLDTVEGTVVSVGSKPRRPEPPAGRSS